MGISTQRVKLDINKQASMQVIRLGQGDKNGTTLIAELYDGGSQYSLSGKTARFVMRTPDRQSSYSVNSSSISNNTATFNVDERYAAGVAGVTDVAYVEVLSGSTVICSTSRMRVICLQSATEGVSPSQMHDNGLDAAIAAANTAASSANTAASNANTKASRAETATTSANTARDNANTAKDAANAAASAATTAAGSANTAAEAANSAKDAANAAATAANTAADSANAATSEANAAIEAMGDISELAVPEMTASVRGGAKVGGSTQVIGGKLEIKLSESATGTSVTTGSTSALRTLQVHGNSVQDGTPTPDAPVPVQVVKGKNLLDALENGSFDGNGLNAASNNRCRSVGYIAVSPGDEYVLQSKSTAGKLIMWSASFYTANDFTTTRISATNWLDANVAAVVPSDAKFMRVLVANKDNSVCTTESFADTQLEAGSEATPYVPHGSIGIVVGDAATSIDLQGNVLASLPDGTRDELHVDSAGHVVVEKRVQRLYFDGSSSENWFVGGNYASTGGGYWRFVNSLGAQINPAHTAYCDKLTYANTGNADDLSNLTVYGNLCSDLRIHPFTPSGQMTVEQLMTWLQSNPLTFYVKYATPQTIDLGYIDPPAIPSGSVVTISASLTPTFDLDCWTEHASKIADTTATLANEINLLRAQIAALATS